jgi:hypothetical protein
LEDGTVFTLDCVLIIETLIPRSWPDWIVVEFIEAVSSSPFSADTEDWLSPAVEGFTVVEFVSELDSIAIVEDVETLDVDVILCPVKVEVLEDVGRAVRATRPTPATTRIMVTTKAATLASSFHLGSKSDCFPRS